jgi:hypothetical protein
MRILVPGAFASRLAHERDTLSSLASRGDVDAGDDGDGAVVFLIYISAAWLRLDLVAVYFRRTFTGLRNRIGFSGVTSFAAVLSGSVEWRRGASSRRRGHCSVVGFAFHDYGLLELHTSISP